MRDKIDQDYYFSEKRKELLELMLLAAKRLAVEHDPKKKQSLTRLVSEYGKLCSTLKTYITNK